MPSTSTRQPFIGDDEKRLLRAANAAFRGGDKANAGTSKSLISRGIAGAKRFADSYTDPDRNIREQESLQANANLSQTRSETNKSDEEGRALAIENEELETKFDSNQFFRGIDPTGKLAGVTQNIMDSAVGGLDGVATKREIRDSYENGSFPAKQLEAEMSKTVADLGEQLASGKRTLEIAVSETGASVDDLRNNEAVGITFKNTALMKELNKLDAFESKVKLLTKKRDQMGGIARAMEKARLADMSPNEKKFETVDSVAFNDDVREMQRRIALPVGDSGRVTEQEAIQALENEYRVVTSEIKARLDSGVRLGDTKLQVRELQGE
jgi:hypothetical protein